MEESLSGTGMSAVLPEALLEALTLPAISGATLELLENALLLGSGPDGTTSIHAVANALADRLAQDRVESLFYAISQTGAVRPVGHDRRGYAYDPYLVDPSRLRGIMHDARVTIDAVRHAQSPRDRVELVATLPESLASGAGRSVNFSSLVAALHRLITDAEDELLILNPFFEQAGFGRLASALLAAAARRVAVCIVTREISNSASVNYRILRELLAQARAQRLEGRFSFWEYQHVEDGRLVLVSHAKVLVADGKGAYIGSANLTDYGLSRYLEIGVVLHGKHAASLSELLHSLISSDDARQMRFPLCEH